MDRLLVATDFSVRSDRALRRATLIARRLSRPLTLVHVVDSDRAEKLIASEHAAASELLDDISATLASEGQVDSDWRVIVDDIPSGILTAADDAGAGLIVIGPHRRRLTDIFTGTTAERLVQRSTCPLLVAVHTPAADHSHTLLALDFDAASKSAGRTALAMGVFNHTDVVVMHAFDAPAVGMMKRSLDQTAEIEGYVANEATSAAEKLRQLSEELGLPSSDQSVSLMEGSAANSILKAARQLDSDLIVLGTNQRKGFTRALVGSVTADVIHDAQRDVLIIPVDERA